MGLWRKVTSIFRGKAPDPALPEPEPPADAGSITPYWFVPVYPRPRKGIPVYKPEEIYASEEERLIKPIFRMLGLTNKAVGKYLTPVVMNYIRYVHLLPASRSDHHSDLEGLLFHGLDTARFAVKFSEGYMPYQGGNPEHKGAYEIQWRVAVTLAGLLHDVGKPATDMIVTSLDGSLEWNPNIESLYDWAERCKVSYYVINYRSNRASLHENPAIITQMISRIVPAETVGFITNNGFREIWEEQFLGSFAADSDSIIRKIVMEADTASVKKDSQNQADESSSAFGISTHIMFARVLRDLLEDHQHGFSWKLNEPGAHAFYSGIKLPDADAPALYITWSTRELQDLWKIADAEKEQLEGFPRNIGRLGEVLADKRFAACKKGSPSVPKFRRVIRGRAEGTFLGMDARIGNAVNELARLAGEDREDPDKIEMVLKSCGLESLPVILFLRKDRVFETEPAPARVYFLEKTAMGFAITPEPAISEAEEPKSAPAPETPKTAPENEAPKLPDPAAPDTPPAPERTAPAPASPFDFAAKSPAASGTATPAPAAKSASGGADDELEEFEEMEELEDDGETGAGSQTGNDTAALMNFLPGGEKSQTPARAPAPEKKAEPAAKTQAEAKKPDQEKPAPAAEKTAESQTPAKVPAAPASPEKTAPAPVITPAMPAKPVMFSFGEPKKKDKAEKPEKKPQTPAVPQEQAKPQTEVKAPAPEKKPEKKFFSFSDHDRDNRKPAKKPNEKPAAARPEEKQGLKITAPDPFAFAFGKPQEKASSPAESQTPAPAKAPVSPEKASPAPVPAPAAPKPAISAPEKPAIAPASPVIPAPAAVSPAPEEKEKPAQSQTPAPVTPALRDPAKLVFTVTAPREIGKEAPRQEDRPDPLAAGAADLVINPDRIREGRRYEPDQEMRREIAIHMVRNQDGIRMMPKAVKGINGEGKAVKTEQSATIQKWTEEMRKGSMAFAGQNELTREEYMAKNGLMMDPALLKRKPQLTDTGKKEARERLRQSYLEVLRKLPPEARELFAPVIRGENKVSSDMLVTNNTLYGLKVDHLWEFGLYMKPSNYEELSGYLLKTNVIRKNPNNPLSLFTQIGKFNCLCLEAKLTEALVFFQLEITPLTDQEKKKAEEGARDYIAATSGTPEPEAPAPAPAELPAKPISVNELISIILNRLADEFQSGGGELSGKVRENPEDWEAEDSFQTIFERIKIAYKNPLLTSTALREKLQSFKPAGARKFKIRQVKRLLLLKGTRQNG